MTDEAIIRKLCEAVARLEGRDALLEREINMMAGRMAELTKSIAVIKYCILILAIDHITAGGVAKLIPMLKGLL